MTVGILLVVLGAILLSQGAQVIDLIGEFTGQSSHFVTMTPIIEPTLLAVGAMNYTYLSVQLDANVQITGSFQVGASNEIDFFVMDEEGFSHWRAGRPTPVLLAALSVSVHNFTLTPSYADSYHFVFENQDSIRHVILFKLAMITERTVVSPLVEYLPYEIIAGGILLSLLGMGGGKRKPQEVPQPASATWRCRFCAQENPLDESFCRGCGRAQQ